MTTIEATSGVAHPVTVSFDGRQITIRRGRLGRNESHIPLSRVTMVNFKKRLTGTGYIEFVGAGTDGKVEFSYWKAAEFSAVKDAVDAALSGEAT